jgi:Fe-S-cluster containining protein
MYQELDVLSANCAAECQKNCSRCCYDYFYVSEVEFYTVLFSFHKKGANVLDNHIDNMFKKSQELLLSLKEHCPAEYEKVYGLNVDYTKGVAYHLNPIDIIKGFEQTLPCVFLNDGKCTIYDVRPFICRTYGTFYDSNNIQNNCNRVHYGRSSGYPESLLKQKINSISMVGDNLRVPKPLFYWFGEIAPRLKRSAFVDLFDIYAQHYADFVFGRNALKLP